MILEDIQYDMEVALRNGDAQRRLVLGEMKDTIQKAAMTKNGRVEPTDEIAINALQRLQKSYEDVIQEYGEQRADVCEQYAYRVGIIKLYTPQLITDKNVIEEMVCNEIFSTGLAMTKKNRGAIMKMIMPAVKGKMDLKIVNEVISNLLK